MIHFLPASCFFKAAIPCWVAVLFFLAAVKAFSAGESLARLLLDEGDYRAARREALRELASEPDCPRVEHVLHAATSLLEGTGRESCGEATSPRRRGRLPALVIGFYRKNIGPAIGQRCQLHPSCSEYMLQASRRHGWLALPLIADRLVREPGVAARAEVPLQAGDAIRFADPVEDHTFWLRGQGGRGAGRGGNGPATPCRRPGPGEDGEIGGEHELDQ